MSPDAVRSDVPQPFAERHRDFQYLVRELSGLERYNRAVLADPRLGDLRLNSFLALSLLALERFLRLVLGPRATEGDTLPNLLEKATSTKRRLFELKDRSDTIKFVNRTRLVVMHGGLGLTAEAEHLLGYLLPLSFDIFRFANEVVAVFDPATGAPRSGAEVSFTPSELASDEALVVQTPLAELHSLREHNRGCGPAGSPDSTFMFAEGALSAILVEAAARRWVGEGARLENARFRTVLKRAVDSGLRMGFDDPYDGIEKLAAVRNTMVHANFEQAAREAGCSDVSAYFREQYAGEIEGMYRVALDFVAQVRARDGGAA